LPFTPTICSISKKIFSISNIVLPGTLLLTSSAWRTPYSCLWSFGDFFDSQQTFHDEDYVEFSKSVQDKVIATKNDTAIIYDIATGQFYFGDVICDAAFGHKCHYLC